MNTLNIDPNEVAKFTNLANSWWDPHGPFKPLHDLNPLRLQCIQDRAPLAGKKVLDIGCGGGILAESLAQAGALVTAIDASDESLNAARIHQKNSGLNVVYLHLTAEEAAMQSPASYDVVVCMELLEHVPDPLSLLKAATAMVKPGGQLFFSTLNRSLKSYMFAIIGAEYLLNILPKGTHDYAKFIRPSELAHWARNAGLETKEIVGINYNPLSREYSLSQDVSVNYLVHMVRP